MTQNPLEFFLENIISKWQKVKENLDVSKDTKKTESRTVDSSGLLEHCHFNIDLKVSQSVCVKKSDQNVFNRLWYNSV